MKKRIKESVTAGIIGGAISSIASGMINYYLIPMPLTILDNSIGHGISGFFCGFISAFLGIMVLMTRHSRQFRQTSAVSG